MQHRLSKEQAERIRIKYSLGILQLDEEVKTLVNDGFDEKIAKQLVTACISEYRKLLFENRIETEKKNDLHNIMISAIIFLSIIGPIFGIRSGFWYFFATITAGVLGYYGFKHKVGGVVVGVMMVLLTLITISYYLADRRSYINIELLIPVAITMILTFLIYWLLAKIFPTNT
ncbi:MAG: hypothetical protein EOO93_19810 [Pedobacter sp.]|nr:MAG: hypothetical protein EOO93_19810 [Pedobacter sp.]